MKKYLLLLVLIIFLSGCSFLFGYSFLSEENDNEVIAYPDEYWTESSQRSDNVVCDLKVSAITSFEDGEIKGQANVDKKTTRLTFVDINSEEPFLIGNLGDESPLAKIDNGNVVYFFETTSFSNMNIFTLFRDKNIMIMSKQYDLIGMPFGMVMMGDCMSGL